MSKRAATLVAALAGLALGGAPWLHLAGPRSREHLG